MTIFTSVPYQSRPDSAISTWLHLTCIAFFSLFLFSSTNGDLGIFGDDILFISHTRSLGGTYLNKIAGRAFLSPFYCFIYDCAGQSTQNTHLVYFALFITSAFLFFFVLRKIFSNTPALIGTLFYIAYAGKYETVTWSSAGGYYVIVLVLFLSICIALSRRLNPWAAAILITLINWFAVHLYEILIVVSPLYPLLYLYYRWRQCKPLINAALWPKFLPMLMFLTHWGLIYFNTGMGSVPIWKRHPQMVFGIYGITKALLNAFWIGIKSSIGTDHYKMILSRNTVTFFQFVPRMLSWEGNVYMLLTFAAAGATLFLCYRLFVHRPDPATERTDESAVVGEMALIGGLYLLFISPLVYVTLITDSMASRFLILPSIGGSILFALILSAVRQRRRGLVFALMALIIYAEAFSFNSIINQHQTSWAYDQNIRRQMLAMNLKPKMGDTIQLSFPRDKLMDDFWRVGLSQYVCGGAHILLLLDYKMIYVQDPGPLHLRLFYDHHEYHSGHEPPIEVPVESLDRPDAVGSKKGTLYPFFLTSAGRLLAISQYNVLDGQGNRLRQVANPVFAQFPADKVTAMDVQAVFASYPLIDQPRDVHFNFYDPNYGIRIHGEHESSSPPFTAQLVQNGRIIDRKTVNDPGYFEWIIPLRQMDATPGEVRILNTETEVHGRKVGWSIKDINLIPEPKK